MRAASVSLKARIALGTISLCRIWSVTRRDGTIKYFTDHDTNVIFDSNTYVATNSFNISNLRSTLAGGSTSADLTIVFSDSGISYDDAIRGFYDNAEMVLSIIDYQNPSYGTITMVDGFLGAISLGDKNVGSCEVIGRLQSALNRIGEFYTPECRASLGDSRCKINIALFSTTGVVTTVTNNRKFRVDFVTDPVNYLYSLGQIKWSSGNNNGTSLECLAQYAIDATIDELILAMHTAKDVQVGDTLTIYAGCDKRPVTCIGTFNNFVNYRGEPHVPNSDKIKDPPRIDVPTTPQDQPEPPAEPQTQTDHWGLLQQYGGYL